MCSPKRVTGNNFILHKALVRTHRPGVHVKPVYSLRLFVLLTSLHNTNFIGF